jgi:endonuclease/exonuclease/phosphatase family metal-dependent hydrolase
MRFRISLALVLPWTLGWLPGCGASDSADRSQEAREAGELSFLTFNGAFGVGLADYPDERLAALIREIPRVEADVVCFNEVWQLPDVVRLVDALAEQYPHSHYSVRSSTEATTGGCSATEASALLNCLTGSCAAVTGDALVSCAVEHCATAFAGVDPGCQNCIISHQDQAASSIVDTCTTDSSNGTTGGEATLVHQNGLVLLSRFPLLDAEYFTLDSSLGDRGVLSARIEGNLVTSTQVFCTHLAANQPSIDYAGDYGSWAGEREAQVAQLLTLTDPKSRVDIAQVVLGDLNSGAATDRADAEEPAAFERLVQAGFDAPYALSSESPCTWCTSNPLTESGSTSSPGTIIDHVLLRGFPSDAEASSTRVLDEPVELDVNGQLVSSHYSDHFGVRVLLTAKP